MKMNNMAKDIFPTSYIVYREVEGANWYWGNFPTWLQAYQVAKDIDGRVIPYNEIDRGE